MSVANVFMLQGIQEWGQTDEARIKAVQDLLDASGFDAIATCSPVFGGIWPKPCIGSDGVAASEWLRLLTKNLKRGEYNSEVRQIEEAIAARKAA